jgi:hypothetical protein
VIPPSYLLSCICNTEGAYQRLLFREEAAEDGSEPTANESEPPAAQPVHAPDAHRCAARVAKRNHWATSIPSPLIEADAIGRVILVISSRPAKASQSRNDSD